MSILTILKFNLSIDSGSNYNVSKTTTLFDAYNRENSTSNGLGYIASQDIHGTGDQSITPEVELGVDNDASVNGELYLFNPSSTTFVKHFMARCLFYEDANMPVDHLTAGYFNTTSAIDEVQFRMHTGNMDSGTFKLYGLKDS